MLQWPSTLRYRAAFIISGQSDKNKTNLQRKVFLRGVCSVASVLDLSTRALQNVESCNSGLENKIWEHQAMFRAQSVTSRFRNFSVSRLCQFSEGFGFSFGKICLKKKLLFRKISKKVSISALVKILVSSHSGPARRLHRTVASVLDLSNNKQQSLELHFLKRFVQLYTPLFHSSIFQTLLKKSWNNWKVGEVKQNRKLFHVWSAKNFHRPKFFFLV